MPEQVATPAIERSEAEIAPSSPPHKKTKYIEPVTSLQAATNEKATTPTPTTMPHNTTTTETSSSTSNTDPDSTTLKIQLLSSDAKAPTRGSAQAAGYDMYASADATVPCSGTRRALVSTGISIAVPAGTYGRVAPRSGLASKHSIDVGAGVIDADYRGEVRILLFNFGDADFHVKAGDRVAQLVLERICTPEVQVVERLEESVRGDGGFGSTGGYGMPPLPTVS